MISLGAGFQFFVSPFSSDFYFTLHWAQFTCIGKKVTQKFHTKAFGSNPFFDVNPVACQLLAKQVVVAGRHLTMNSGLQALLPAIWIADLATHITRQGTKIQWFMTTYNNKRAVCLLQGIFRVHFTGLYSVHCYAVILSCWDDASEILLSSFRDLQQKLIGEAGSLLVTTFTFFFYYFYF